MDTLVCAGAFAAAYLLARRSPQGGGAAAIDLTRQPQTYGELLEALGYSLGEEAVRRKTKKLVATKGGRSYVVSRKTDERNGRPGWKTLLANEKGLTGYARPKSFGERLVVVIEGSDDDQDSQSTVGPPADSEADPLDLTGSDQDDEPVPSAPFVSDVHGVELTQENLNSLNRKEWLDDNVICAYLKILEARNGTPGYDNVWFCEPIKYLQIVIALERIKKKTQEKEQSKKSIEQIRQETQGKNKLVFVCNVRGNHWCVVAVDGDEAYYLDSLYKASRRGGVTVADNVDQTVQEFLERQGLKFLPTTTNKEPPECGGVAVPQQTNGHDCGVFALAMAEAFQKTGELELRFHQGQAAGFRRYLKRVLKNPDEAPFDFSLS